MMTRRARRIESDLELIKTILTIRDPGSPIAAEAYDGLRRAIAAAAEDRTAHLVHLAQINSAILRGEDRRSLELLLRDLMAQAGLEQSTDPDRKELYDVDGNGNALSVIEPAYIDSITGRLVRQGRAHAEMEPTNEDTARSAVED